MVIVDFSNFLYVASKLLQGSHHSLAYCLFYTIPHPMHNNWTHMGKAKPHPIKFHLGNGK